MIYKCRAGARLEGDIQAIGQELEIIRQRDGGLVPSAVVEQAKPKSNPLHPNFEWNDKTAARLYREDQARYVIRSVDVVYETGEESHQREVRAFVAVQKDDGSRIYESTAEALSNDLYRKQVLASAFRELQQVRTKYAELQELAEVFQAVDRVAELMQEPTAVV